MRSPKTCPTQNGKHFYTYDKKQNLCIHPAMQCSLGTESVKYRGQSVGTCYDNSGNVNPKKDPNKKNPDPNSTNQNKKKKTLAGQCASLMPFGGDSKGKPKIIQDIEELQKQEVNILNEMKKDTDMSTGKIKNQSQMDALMTQLKSVQDARIRLLQQLSYVSSTTQCTLSGDRTALQDQIAMLMVAEDQLKNIEKQTQDLINSRTNKHRMVEITNYEYNRFSSHASIFKTIAFCSLFILGGVYLNGMGWNTVGNSLIVLSIAVAVFLTIKRIWWNYYRNPMNWNQFEWSEKTPGGHQPSVWEVDKKFFDRGYKQAKSEFHRAEKDASKAYDKVKKDVGKAYKDVDRAYKGVTKDFNKDLTAASAGHGKKKGIAATESFAPYN